MALIEGQNAGRIQSLVPVRRGRMVESAFTFYRGTAIIMASDLSRTPVSGITVQICGDAHLSNFGAYGSAERDLVFDVNDFDETLEGPWEWDVKRLATSFAIAGRHRGFHRDNVEEITARSIAGYRGAMREFAEMTNLDIWYSRFSSDDLIDLYRSEGKKKAAKRADRKAQKARSKDSRQALSKFGESVDGVTRIRSDPPGLAPLRDIQDVDERDHFERATRESFARYRATLRPDRRVLLNQYQPLDIAMKVVGVGSVGTRCFILLLQGRDEEDPLFLQVKEAGRSVLETHLPVSPHENHGERVVQGQRLMQASSDIFLGWSPAVENRDYYWRQLRDWKLSFDVDDAKAKELRAYAEMCGWTLARSHARSGDPVAIAAYLGKNDSFDRAVTEFAERYADQNDRDYEAFSEAIRSGDLEADLDG